MAFDPPDTLVTSLYLNTDRGQFPLESEYKTALRSLLSEAHEKVLKWKDMSHAQQGSLEEDLRGIRTYIEYEFVREDTKGLAVFSCSDQNFWEVLPLPRPVPSRAVVDAHFHVRELVGLAERFKRFCVILVDREGARIFTLHLGRLEEHRGVLDDVPGRVKAATAYEATERKIERHISFLVHEHLKRVRDVLLRFCERQKFDYLIIGGREALHTELEDLLPDDLRRRIAGRIPVSTNAPTAEVLKRSLEVERDVEIRRAHEAVRRLKEEVGSGNRGVVGLEITLRSLTEHRVQSLILADGFTQQGRRCAACGYLTAELQACPFCREEAAEVPDVVEEAVKEAFKQSAEVIFVTENEDLKALENVGAILRY